MAERELKPGKYVGHIQQWSLGKASTGNPQFTITFALAYYKLAGGGQEDCPSLERTIFRSITDKTIDFFVKDLQALGYDRDTFDALDPKAPDAFDFQGIEIEASLKYETYEGKEREKWNLAMTGGGLVIEPLEQSGLASLNAMFGSNLKAMRAAGAVAAPRRAEPAPAGADPGSKDEEIPF